MSDFTVEKKTHLSGTVQISRTMSLELQGQWVTLAVERGGPRIGVRMSLDEVRTLSQALNSVISQFDRAEK